MGRLGRAARGAALGTALLMMAALRLHDRYGKPSPLPDGERRPPAPMMTVTYEAAATGEAKAVFDFLRREGLVEQMAERLDALLAWLRPAEKAAAP